MVLWGAAKRGEARRRAAGRGGARRSAAGAAGGAASKHTEEGVHARDIWSAPSRGIGVHPRELPPLETIGIPKQKLETH